MSASHLAHHKIACLVKHPPFSISRNENDPLGIFPGIWVKADVPHSTKVECDVNTKKVRAVADMVGSRNPRSTRQFSEQTPRHAGPRPCDVAPAAEGVRPFGLTAELERTGDWRFCKRQPVKAPPRLPGKNWISAKMLTRGTLPSDRRRLMSGSTYPS